MDRPMKVATALGAACLALAAVPTACTTVGNQPAHNRVYLVGVAGAG
jgi:hypothetical protein